MLFAPGRGDISEKLVATYDGAKCHMQDKGKILEEVEFQSGVRSYHRYLFFSYPSGYFDWRMLVGWIDCVNFFKHLNWSDDITSKIVGLKTNNNKTKVLSLKDHRTLPICINRQNIKAVESLVYLGSAIFADGDTGPSSWFCQNLEMHQHQAPCQWFLLAAIQKQFLKRVKLSCQTISHDTSILRRHTRHP